MASINTDALDSHTRDSLAALSPAALLDAAAALAARCRALQPARAGGRRSGALLPRRRAAPRCWPLNLELTTAVLARLPSAARLAARAVCREWRAILADASLWRSADVSEQVPALALPRPLICSRHWHPKPPQAIVAALFAAATRATAGNALTALDVSGVVPWELRFDRLIQAAGEYKRSLRVIRALDCSSERMTFKTDECCLGTAQIDALLRATTVRRGERLVQLLEVLEVDLRCNAEAAARLVANPVVRVRRLSAVFSGVWNMSEPSRNALLDVVNRHAALTQLHLTELTLDTTYATMLCEAVAAKRLSVLRLYNCQLTPAELPALTALLQAGHLRELSLRCFNCDAQHDAWDAQPTPMLLWALTTVRARWRDLCSALAGSKLCRLGLAGPLAAGARWQLAPLVDSVTAHPTLEELTYSARFSHDLEDEGRDDDDWVPTALAHARAMARIVAANAPALRALVLDVALGEPGLAAFLPSLAANTHLQLLSVWCIGMRIIKGSMIPDEDGEVPPVLSACFVETVLRPALLRSPSLRRVCFAPLHPYYYNAYDDDDDDDEHDDAEWRVAERALRRALAAIEDEVPQLHHARAYARDWVHATWHWTRAAPMEE